MTEQKWIVIDEVAGSFQANVIEGLLKAKDIPVVVSKPGAGVAIGVTVGSLGRVQILVPNSELDRAQQVVENYYSGEYEDQILADIGDVDKQSGGTNEE